MEIDADLHLHGYYSSGVSDRMKIPDMAAQSQIKGLDLVGTGDILHPQWRQHVQNNTQREAPGIYGNEDCNFLLTTEVEDTDRIHHIIFFPDMDTVEQVASAFSQRSTDIDSEGRPHLEIKGKQIAGIAKDHDSLIGPAHAFTPWTAIYKEYNSLKDCYGKHHTNIDFLELGLSADTAFADRISHHNDITFLSNSDAHSPWPHRMGREFNRFQLQELSFDDLRKALHRKGGRTIVQNVGFDPREGKYHCTACQDCHQKYTLEQAEQRGWTCAECGNSIKKGVKDRISELADGGTSPAWRPTYTHLVPLAEIIREVVGHSSVTTKTVQSIYDEFLDTFKSEIQILIDQPIEELEEVNSRIASAVQTFRNEDTIMVPGGGGKYGELIIPSDKEEKKRIEERRAAELDCRYEETQTSLGDF